MVDVYRRVALGLRYLNDGFTPTQPDPYNVIDACDGTHLDRRRCVCAAEWVMLLHDTLTIALRAAT